MDLLSFHIWLAWVTVISNAIVGFWAVAAHFKGVLRKSLLWRVTIFAQIALFLEAIMGVVLFQDKSEEVNQFHLFYGFLALASVGFMFAYREQLKNYIYLMYGLGSLFIMGLALRAIQIPAIN